MGIFDSKIIVLSMVTLLSLCSFTGCGGGLFGTPSESMGREFFEKKASEAIKAGVVVVETFKKTNGIKRVEAGVEQYVLEYEVGLFYPRGFMPECIDDSHYNATCFSVRRGYGIGPSPFKEPDEHEIESGKIVFEKTEQGWRAIKTTQRIYHIGENAHGVAGQAGRSNKLSAERLKSMASDFQNVKVYIYGYQGNHRVLPGDDHAANVHNGGTNPANGTQNGKIEGHWNTAANGDESCVFWEHVRRAGFASGSTAVNCGVNNEYQPKNIDGGLIGVESVANLATITGMTGGVAICSDGILGTYATKLDAMLDDGETSSGSVRAITSGKSGKGMSTSAIKSAPSSTYTVCMAI